MPAMNQSGEAMRVVVAGGGIAALEVLAGLRALAGERVAATLLSLSDSFSYRPLSTAVPFTFRDERTSRRVGQRAMEGCIEADEVRSPASSRWSCSRTLNAAGVCSGASDAARWSSSRTSSVASRVSRNRGPPCTKRCATASKPTSPSEAASSCGGRGGEIPRARHRPPAVDQTQLDAARPHIDGEDPLRGHVGRISRWPARRAQPPKR
jgi:hypothetical protein